MVVEFGSDEVNMNSKTKLIIITCTGLLLVTSGALFILTYAIIIALPVYLIGLLIIWNTQLKTKFKVLCTVLPLVLPVPFWRLVDYIQISRMSPESKFDFIVDEDFRGKIVIINNLNCAYKHEIGKRTKIIVPKNGITHCEGDIEINNSFIKVMEKSKTGKTKEFKFYSEANGKKQILSFGQIGSINVEGINYTLDMIYIDNELSFESFDSVPEEEIRQYIKKCKNDQLRQ